LRNLGNKTSRVLPAEDRSFTGVVFQPLRPPLDSEWNLVQAIGVENLRNLVSAITTSGFVIKGPITGRPSSGTNVWKHTISIPNPTVLINGHVFHVGGGTNQFQANATQNVWQMLGNGDENSSFFIIGDGPSIGSREDLVFLEVWEEVISSDSYIPKYGNSQYAGTPIANDLVDSNIGRETTKRTQIKYRYRVVEGVDFLSFREGVDHPAVFAQGAKTSPIIGKNFVKTPQGHFIAGGGTNTDTSALGTVDGYVYALPVCAIHRRNRLAYSSTNLNGGNKKIEDLVSDRPDGLFVDEIADHEIEDLRHVVDFNINYPSLADKSLRDILDGLPNRLSLGGTSELFSAKNLQVDGISTTERSGIADNMLRKPNGIRRSFTDNEMTERVVQYITAGSLVNGRLEIEPPVFYTSADSDDYQDYNPFIGLKKIPKVTNATTGSEISADTSVGISGWVNLGDRLKKNKVTFKPLNNNDILGKPLLVEYDLVLPAGSGLSYLPTDFYSVRDDLTSKEVLWSRDQKIRNLAVTRTINGYLDSAFIRPASNFINPTTAREDIKGGLVERVWHTVGNGTSKVTVPATIDNMAVLTVMRVQKADTAADLPLGFGQNAKITRKSDGSYEVNFASYFPASTDVIKITLLLGGTGCEVITPNRGLVNFVRTTYLTITTVADQKNYTIRQATSTGNRMEYVYALAGYQDTPNTYKYGCFISDSLTTDGAWLEIDTITGLNTISLTVSFLTAPPAGKTVRIPVLGSYAPLGTDLYSILYSSIPYQGLSNTLSDDEELEADLVYLSNDVIVTSNGTGGVVRNDHEVGKTIRLPINSTDYDYEFTSRNVSSFAVENKGATNKFHYTFSYFPETKPLEEGDRLVFKKISSSSSPNYPRRGLALISPKISIQGGKFSDLIEEDLSVQTTGTNKIFTTREPILNIYGTYCLSRLFIPDEVATFQNGQRTVNGVGSFFTRVLVPGMKIRPFGTTTWYTVHTVQSDSFLNLKTAFSGTNITDCYEIYMPDLKVFVDGVELDPESIDEIRGRDNTIILKNAPAVSSEVKIMYRTGQNTMNIVYGIAVGRGIYKNELLLFTLTSTASAEWVSTPEFNLLKQGKANSLIINNNAVVVSTTGQKNEANRILGAAELFYPTDRIIKVRTKVD